DMMARADLASYTPLPWKPGLARFASDLHVDGAPFPYCPRVNLKRVLAEVRAAGFVFNVGVEPEHFLVRRTAHGGIAPWDPAIVTFMAKPFADRTGSAAHMHYHLADAESGRNLFAADADPRNLGLSELAYHFLGGVLTHARALCAVTSPTVNCYKRLQIGSGLYSTHSGYT